MRSPRPRRSATPSDGDDGSARRRRPFRSLQPRPSPPRTKSTPREVILTPRATPKPMKRRVSSRLKRAAIKVKSEPPEIDVSKVRPPSPSEDPLLLLASHSPPLRTRFTPVFSSSPSGSTCSDPPVSFAARLCGTRIGPLESTPDADVDALPMFNAPRVVEETGGTWSDSEDDDGFNLTGDYTGKYKILKVPTKADLTSGTRERTDSWGRPVSPFPYSEIMERSLPPSDFAEESNGRDDVYGSGIPCEDADMWEVATEPPLSDVELSPPPSVSGDEFAGLDDDFSLFAVDAESTQVLPTAEPRPSLLDSDQTVLEEREEEAQIDRELSVAIDDGPGVPPVLSEAGLPAGTGEDDSSDEEDVGEDIIKITSGDPKAAARAAAILRMHDYDCILAAEKKKRLGQSAGLMRKRRKTIENAGISKPYMDLKSQRWKTLQGVKTSPGSRSLPLLELWRDAEDSVFLEHQSPLLPPLTGEWTRDCWKRLDKCLTAERLAVAAARGLGTDILADTGIISKDAVLDRFVSQVGGESVLGGLGPDWSRDNLILRLNVLIKKQLRSAARGPRVGLADSFIMPEPRHHGLLQEAMALSAPLERCPTSTSTSSDNTVVPEPDVSLYAEPGWQVNYLRGSARTPSRTPDPMSPHPKDQVHLRHASPQKSMILVPMKPKRLVDLRHLSPTKADGRLCRSAARLSSGCSVRDLVRQFESLDK